MYCDAKHPTLTRWSSSRVGIADTRDAYNAGGNPSPAVSARFPGSPTRCPGESDCTAKLIIVIAHSKMRAIRVSEHPRSLRISTACSSFQVLAFDRSGRTFFLNTGKDLWSRKHHDGKWSSQRPDLSLSMSAWPLPVPYCIALFSGGATPTDVGAMER
ncbi:hypothetical protein A0H81_01746 [Grifola frondosa]|uniref:Uncharacterized protein n=1 Tax=Grifola frondosa TaxID=5627 RepID=A0A1C7MMD0_GRIFR|nr:hypothetical protein A0H81_01746 [Grifola frondosa]